MFVNNPIKYSDPSGHCVWDGCVLEAVVAGVVISVAVDAFVTTQNDPVGESRRKFMIQQLNWLYQQGYLP
jgi:hypothetical protein